MPAARTWSRPAFLALAVVVLVELVLFVGYHRERWRKALLPRDDERVRAGEGLVIRCDGHGYYAWLRSLLIDGDLSFDNEFDDHNPLGDWVPPVDARTRRSLRANYWSVGPACCWSLTVVPGHLAVTALQPLGLPWPADGYSLPYQFLVGGTTVLVSLLGLVFLYGICRHFARPTRAALAAAFLTLGSTVVFYSAVEVSMAHGMGTAAVAGLVWYWLTTYGSDRPGRWLKVGLLVGVAALMRWQLATFALLPVGECLLSWRRGGRPVIGLGLAALGAGIGFLPQVLAWRAVYGEWLVLPYATGRHWLYPALGEVLGSTDRGLFYWTPITILALAGLLVVPPAVSRLTALAPGSRLNKREALGLLLASFLVQVYVVASLWGEQAFLGVSFGFRPLTEAVVVLAPGLALLLERASARRFRFYCGVCLLLVVWNLLLIAQYRYGLIPADAGAGPMSLLAGAARLVVRKKFLLLGQVVLGPALLALVARAADRAAEIAIIPGCPLTNPQQGCPDATHFSPDHLPPGDLSRHDPRRRAG